MTLPAPRGVPYRISMVCLGNICRSPMAAAVLLDRIDQLGLGGEVAVDSAGTGSWHVGQPADARARAALAARGYDGEDHRAQQVQPAWFDEYDLILAMDHDNVRTLRRLAPNQDAAARVLLLRAFDPDAEGSDDHVVPDPYYGDDRDFTDGLDIIERSVDGLVDALRDLLTPTT